MSDDSFAIVQYLFALAANRVGGEAALGQHLGVAYRELSPYLNGYALPPADVLLRAADLVVDDLETLRSAFSEQAWRSLALVIR